ncbi:glycosyl transferase family 2 [Methylobacterium sp. 4-46]|uniref:glycosyltransferase family 2 protein n=1 Tax=unclassified Methylobacterium TaxID=2615210 RepID=UPI000152D903|nr:MULTISPECIES: glycosyltransferase family 2 protein [Methylobacterium]ACA18388.1 glycosyl transferase family 2 [Methylobacterium sp. 4-46]WFT77678.1 glycosyltransferase family 2 protein [Methylobacterium nodulans]
MTASDVTVVVPTFNRGRDLPATLAALAAQTRRPRAVVVVDNSSTDDTRAVVGGWGPALAAVGIALHYRCKAPEGPAAARNLGWREADTAAVAFVDSDVSLDPGWLAACGAALDADQDIGAVGGKVVYAHRPDLLNGYGGALGPLGLAWDALEGEPATAATRARDVLWTNCSALLVRRKALAEIDGFDEAFFYGYEDSDLGWRLTLGGWRVRVVPEAVVHHRVGSAIGRAAETIVFHAAKNRLRSVLVNWGAARLLRHGPPALAYSLADAVLRAPRGPKLRALLWTLRHLPDTLARRRMVQASRRVDDRGIRALMDRRAFPKRRLGGLRRRAADVAAPPILGADDRV